jgi:hypothetical protein
MATFAASNAALKWGRWILREAGWAVPGGLAWLSAQLDESPAAPAAVEWRRYNIRGSRSTPAGTSEDLAQFKLDLLNITSSEIDTTWTTGDYTAVRARLDTMIAALKVQTAGTFTYTDISAYRMRFNPVGDLTKPFQDSGPPVYKATIAQAGTGGGTYPYQVAATCTFKTGWPKHWGRIYLPNPIATAGDANGRWTSTYRTAVANAVSACIGGLADDGFFTVVPVGQLNKEPFHALLGVNSVVVDDVPDVQRRRRPKQVLNRTVGA